ncbi:MAG: ankyrin repeat domain-containing protein [Flavobacterium sp.]|uniref:ankyrin repeat domain-containing protein n=1 Tax=Flavobacterium sp. TaxID=239 RepID=UPI0027323C5D|nr:ankyrin repeat domain-containing protein [Flavobacterium sp.]MDP3681344.1 ankyrin repeat domain-containing protein [Flavobacterium sp.]MDZ4331837.1 ankyrin repeat domain-containing protein [Flavobacterium sp.]
MKKNLFISFALVATLFVSAQQKNTLLEQSFWKTTPDVNAVKAEIAKGNSPSASTPNAFDVTVMAINNDAPEATIKFLLEQPGNEVTKSTHDNRIYLHWAANKGNTAIVEHLIAKGSDINLEDSQGFTPITFAANNGQNNTAVYDALFKAGIDPKKKYKDGLNLLFMAIPSDKNLILTTYFVSKGLSLKDIDNDGNTAFNYAARTGNVTLLKTLLEKGVKYTDNALIIAAQGSRRDANTIETYKYLVEELKLKPTVTSKTGETVLHFLVSKSNQTEIINYFLAKGVDANKADNEGNTALMAAAGSREIAALELLLPIVKNINIQNGKGESALTMAVKSGTPEAVALLLSKGAAANVQDKDGNNLGYYLIQSYRPIGRGPEAANGPKQDPFEAKIKLLQDKGLNVVTPQKDGSTLYHFAIAKNDLTLLKKITDLSVDVNAKNKDGLTALHKAAMISKDDTILKYLISIGAKKEITTDFDESAYALAKENESLTKNNVSLEFLK